MSRIVKALSPEGLREIYTFEKNKVIYEAYSDKGLEKKEILSIKEANKRLNEKRFILSETVKG